MIFSGEKTVETKAPPKTLAPYVGKRVGLVRTGKGKATLVGYATLGEPIHYPSVEAFRADYEAHRLHGTCAALRTV